MILEAYEERRADRMKRMASEVGGWAGGHLPRARGRALCVCVRSLGLGGEESSRVLLFACVVCVSVCVCARTCVRACVRVCERLGRGEASGLHSRGSGPEGGVEGLGRTNQPPAWWKAVISCLIRPPARP